MKVNFRIEKKNLNDKKSNVRLDFTYSGKRFRKFIGIKIFNNHWHKSKQRVKSSSSDALIINKRLEVLEKKVVKIYYDLLNNNEPISNSILSEKLEDSIKGVSSESTFFSYAKRFIEDGVSMKKKSTLDGYRYTIGCLKRFERYSRRKINWETLDLKFYKEYQLYQFKELKNSANLFGRRITDLKAIINDATKVGVNKYLDFKDFKITRTTSSRVYLNDEEINKLFFLELDNKRLERVRDIFLLTCLDISSANNLISLNCSGNIIDQLITKNGNWQNMYVNAISNNLSCVEVDNIGYATNNWTFDNFTNINTNCNYSTSCNNISTSIDEVFLNRKLINTFNILGKETNTSINEILFYIYDDGTVEKKIIIE